MTRKYMTIPAVVAGALGMGNAIAWGAEPTADELMQQIEQLQAKVQQLEQKQATTATAADVDATVSKVLEDAEKRSKLMQMDGFTAGWSDGFVLQSGDGNFMLRPFFQFQSRYVVNYRDEETPGGDEDVQKGFEIPRMKLGAWGNLFTPDLTYNFRWASGENNNRGEDLATDSPSGSSGTLVLENAYMQYFFNDDWAFRLGQWKDNWTHEETVESYHSLAVDRSLMNDVLGGGLTRYVQALGLLYQPPDTNWRGMFTYQDGLNTSNTPFTYHNGGSTLVSAPAGSSFAPNWGASGRFEYKMKGDWRSYDDFSAMNNRDDLLVLGAGANWNQDGSDNVFLHTFDVQWETGSWGVYGAYVGNWASYDSVVGADDTYDAGVLVQVGYMWNEKWEVFGRIDYMFLDDSNVSFLEDTVGEWMVGVNYYWHGHRAKFTFDVGLLPDGTPGGASFSNLGYLSGPDEFQFAVRGQFQLLL